MTRDKSIRMSRKGLSETPLHLMDEFADLEKELLGNGFKKGFHQLEDFVFEIEERPSQSNTIFWRDEIDLSPKHKRYRLIFGVLFTPLMGLGLLLIWSVIRLGPIDEQTSIIRGRGYHQKLHSIVNYEIQNGRVHSAKASKINENAYIRKSKQHSDADGWRWDYEIINGKFSNISLGDGLHRIEPGDVKDTDFVSDFAKRTKLEIKEYFPHSWGNTLKGLFSFLAIVLVVFWVLSMQ